VNCAHRSKHLPFDQQERHIAISQIDIEDCAVDFLLCQDVESLRHPCDATEVSPTSQKEFRSDWFRRARLAPTLTVHSLLGKFLKAECRGIP
jgi:hypothetical protein